MSQIVILGDRPALCPELPEWAKFHMEGVWVGLPSVWGWICKRVWLDLDKDKRAKVRRFKE